MSIDLESIENKKIIRYLQKQARLQGFVSEIEISNLTDSEKQKDAITTFFKDKGVEVNPYLKSKRRVKKDKINKLAFKDPKNSDPTWSYLNQVKYIPLLDKGEEIQYARQMSFAKSKLLESAYHSLYIQTFIFRLDRELESGVLDLTDVLYFDEEYQDDTYLEEAYNNFKDNIGKIKDFSDKISNMQHKHKLSTGDIREKIAEKLREIREELVDSCNNLGLNDRQKTSIIEKYSAWLKQNSFSDDLENLKNWEKIFNDAKHAVIESNVRLVVSIAKKFYVNNMEMIDIIQEGNSGLIKAVENFDYRKGYKFSTYATWWITQAIIRSINDKSKIIRIPANTLYQLNKVNRYNHRFVLENGFEPTPADISEALSIPVKKVKLLLAYTGDPISMELSSGGNANSDGNDNRVFDFVEDETAENPADIAVLNNLRENIDTVLGDLDEKERDILTMRFGLDNGTRKTLTDIGEMLNISRERVRQIETRALSKLKHPSRNGVFKEWQYNRDELIDT